MKTERSDIIKQDDRLKELDTQTARMAEVWAAIKGLAERVCGHRGTDDGPQLIRIGTTIDGLPIELGRIPSGGHDWDGRVALTGEYFLIVGQVGFNICEHVYEALEGEADVARMVVET